MKKLLPLLLLVGAVIVSGCVGQDGDERVVANGLIISSFSPDASSIPAGDSIELLLEVENVGGSIAENTVADLSGVTFGSGELDWDCGNDITDVSLATKLLPPEEGIPGDIDSYSWICKSPKGIRADTPYTFDVRVTYGYLTDVTAKLNFVTGDYWSSLSQAEKKELAGGVSYLSQTPGPLSIKVYSGSRTRPFVIYEDYDKNDPHPLRIIITNVGSGKPVDYEVIIKDVDISQGARLVDCDGAVTLSRGKSATHSCKVYLDDPDSVINRQDFTISLTFDYEWYVDSSTTVTVEKPLT